VWTQHVSMTIKDDHSVADASQTPKFLAAGGILAALGAASCCVVPFALFTLGISGAWIGNLTALEPYQPVFAAIAVASLGYGFYLVYRQPKAACAEGCYWPGQDHKNGRRPQTDLGEAV
jgi:mercuric ion transport protein